MKRIFSKILAFSFALIIPLTAFFISTTNQKKVSASETFDRIDFYEFYDDEYFNVLDSDSILAGTGTSVQYNFGNYQYTPTLNIPYLSNNYVLSGNSFVYDYTLDSTTYYTLTRSKFNDFMVMYSPSSTNYISFDFTNLVLFYYDGNGVVDKNEFVSALTHYFSRLIFVIDGIGTNVCDINLSGSVSHLNASNIVNFENYLCTSKNNDVPFNSHRDYIYNFFGNLFDCYEEITSSFVTSRLNGNLIDFTDSNVLNYYNAYFILPYFNITFNFDYDVRFYLRSKLYDYTLDNLYSQGDYTNLYAYNLYRPDFIYTILGYYGYDTYFQGFYKGKNLGYIDGFNDGMALKSPFDTILGTVESFLNFEIFPDFHLYYIFLMAFGFAIFGLIIKYAFGG